MDLKSKIWTKDDIKPFLEYLESFSQRHKAEWGKKILNTQLDVLVIPTQKMKDIASDIYQGHFESFLDLKVFTNYETIALYGMIISKMKSFEMIIKYLDIYAYVMENWAHCDLLTLNITKENIQEFIALSNTYLKSDHVFIRRLGLLILFQLIKDKEYLEYILNTVASLKDEDAYYVIMMAGWLLSECIILYRSETLSYIKKHTFNPKILNKGIQKCRESRKLSQMEKDDLLTYKIKKIK